MHLWPVRVGSVAGLVPLSGLFLLNLDRMVWVRPAQTSSAKGPKEGVFSGMTLHWPASTRLKEAAVRSSREGDQLWVLVPGRGWGVFPVGSA